MTSLGHHLILERNYYTNMKMEAKDFNSPSSNNVYNNQVEPEARISKTSLDSCSHTD